MAVTSARHVPQANNSYYGLAIGFVILAGAVAVGGLVIVFRRWQRESELDATPEDQALVEQALAERT